jgi:hypothetical protein
LIAAERAAGRAVVGDCAVTSYIWLKRALEFVAETFNQWMTTTNEFKVCFSTAYASTLSKHHTGMQRRAFSMALIQIPTRAYLYARFGSPPTEEYTAYFKDLQTVTSALP